MIWDIDTLPKKKYLNTTSWGYFFPKLYKKYPNEGMVINFAVSSAPIVNITKGGIGVQAGVDMKIEVKDGGEVVPIAYINMICSLYPM